MQNHHKKDRILTPQTPGVNPTPAQMPPQEGDELPLPEADASQASTITMTMAEYDQMMSDAKTQAIKEYRRSLRDAKAESDLPEQSEIDASTITRAVLTRDGYVCPKPPAERKGPLI